MLQDVCPQISPSVYAQSPGVIGSVSAMGFFANDWHSPSIKHSP
jgi:hypothetical protein